MGLVTLIPWSKLPSKHRTKGRLRTVPAFVSWVLGFVSWVLGFVNWVLGFVFWVSGFVFWVSGFVFWVSGIVCWVSGIVFWVSGIVFWVSGISIALTTAAPQRVPGHKHLTKLIYYGHTLFMDIAARLVTAEAKAYHLVIGMDVSK